MSYNRTVRRPIEDYTGDVEDWFNPDIRKGSPESTHEEHPETGKTYKKERSLEEEEEINEMLCEFRKMDSAKELINRLGIKKTLKTLDRYRPLFDSHIGYNLKHFFNKVVSRKDANSYYQYSPPKRPLAYNAEEALKESVDILLREIYRQSKGIPEHKFHGSITLDFDLVTSDNIEEYEDFVKDFVKEEKSFWGRRRNRKKIWCALGV